MTFFEGGPGGHWVLELRGVSGGGFLDPKIDQFRAKFKNKPNLGLNSTKLA